MTDPPSSKFSASIPKLQLVWSAHSLDALQFCPKFYEYTILENYTSPFENNHIRFGIEFHKALETYDKLRAEGIDRETALTTVIRQTLASTWNFDQGRPWVSDEPTKTRTTLLRTIILYIDKYANDPLETTIQPDGSPMVEVQKVFNLGPITSSGEEYLLRARLDRGVRWNNQNWIPDYKTTKYELNDRYFDAFSPDNQVSILSIIGNVTIPNGVEGVIIDAMQILVNGTRFRRREIPRSLDQLEEWLTDLAFWFTQAELFATANFWPRNRKNCRTCMFKGICSAEPAIRQTLLDATFVKQPRDDDSFR